MNICRDPNKSDGNTPALTAQNIKNRSAENSMVAFFLLHFKAVCTLQTFISLILAFSSLCAAAWDLFPITPPPQCFLISSNLSLKLVLTASQRLVKLFLSSGRTAVKHSAVAVFLCTTLPNLKATRYDKLLNNLISSNNNN